MSKIQHVKGLGPAQAAVLNDVIVLAINQAAKALREVDIDVGIVDISLTAARDPKDADAVFTIRPSEQGDRCLITFHFPDVGGMDAYEWLFTSFENAADVARLIRDEPSYAFAADPVYGLPVRGTNISRLRQLIAHEMSHIAVFRALGREALLLLEEHSSVWFKTFSMLQHDLMVTKPQVEATHGMRFEEPFVSPKMRMHA